MYVIILNNYGPDTVPESHVTAVMSNVCEHTEYLSTQLEHKPL